MILEESIYEMIKKHRSKRKSLINAQDRSFFNYFLNRTKDLLPIAISSDLWLLPSRCHTYLTMHRRYSSQCLCLFGVSHHFYFEGRNFHATKLLRLSYSGPRSAQVCSAKFPEM